MLKSRGCSYWYRTENKSTIYDIGYTEDLDVSFGVYAGEHFLTSEAIPNPDNDNFKPNTNPAIISSNKYKINDNFISGVDINTTVTEFINNITNTSGNNVKILKENKEITGDENLSTSTILKINDNSIYTIIVNGDINEDGKISVTDLSRLKRTLVGL